MQKIKNKLILLKEDYNMLKGYIQSMVSVKSAEKNSLMQLEKELLKGPVIVEKKDFPEDTVRLNSEVTVQERSTGRKLQVKLVLPSEANFSLGRISLFAPMAIALIGYSKGHLVKWQMPGGKKEFLILDVLNTSS
jgi:regulator of nucleoside diphosphate kinase